MTSSSSSSSSSSPPLLYDPIAPRGRRSRAPSNSKTGVKVLNSIREEIIDKSSDVYQRTSWIILQRSIYNLLNKINSESDIQKMYEKLLQLNIFRGRGMFCRLIMDDMLYSNQNTNYFAALVSLINVHFTEIGELLITRLILKFKSAYFQQNNKSQCLSSVAFIAHLINHNVADPKLAFELLHLLLKPPTENSIEIACMIWSVCGHKLNKTNRKKVNAITEIMKTMSRDKRLNKKVQCIIKVALEMISKNRYTYQKFNTVVKGSKHTHILDLNDIADPQNNLDYYHFDPEYESNEYINKLFCEHILEIHNEAYVLICDTDGEIDNNNNGNMLNDKLDYNLTLLRRTISIIVNSSCNYENSALKLMDSKLKPGQELDMCFMILDFCCQHKIYNESLGHATQILCQLNKSLIEPLEDLFIDTYENVHNFDMIKLRNVAKLFAHLLFTDTLSWRILSKLQLNETDSTHSSRTYIKILFQELVEHMGMDMLIDRIQNPFLKKAFEGIFLGDNQNNPKFAVNFFMSIGLDGVIDKFRSSIIFKLKKVSSVGDVSCST